MKHAAMILLAGLAAGCMAEEPVEVAHETHSRTAEALAGRTAGAPVDCVDMRQLRGNRSLGDNSILFESAGDMLYLNRPAGTCTSLEFGRALRTRTIGTRLCRGDIVTVFDPVSGIEFGGCGLGDFVPYRRES